MKFTGYVRPVKADLTKQTITIAFEIEKTDGATVRAARTGGTPVRDGMAEAEQLAFYADKDAGLVDILVTPRQLRMFQESPAGAEERTEDQS